MPDLANTTLHLSSHTENLVVIREFIAKQAAYFGFNEDDIFKIELAVDEAITNVIKHAYNKDWDHMITIHVKSEGNQFIIIIEDQGKPFDVASVKAPDLEAYIKMRKKGGLGIHLIKTYMDEFLYERKNDSNFTTLIKTKNYSS